MNDRAIIKKLKQNNEKAIKELIDKYGRYVAAVVCGVSGAVFKAEDVEEVVSDVFYSVWKNRHNILEIDSIKPYLAQAARNITKNKFSQVKDEQLLDDEIEAFDTEATEELIIRKEKISIVKEFMGTMKYPDKDILAAYYFRDYKLEDIAAMYELPLSTVKSKIYRGRKTIIEYFKERGYIYEN